MRGVLAIDTLIEENRSFEEELMDRERKVEWQIKEGKSREAKYNKRYKKLEEDGETPKYLRKKFLERTKFGTGGRALAKKGRCGNMEEDNKYCIEEKERVCLFCGKGKDRIEHFVKECRVAKEWFRNLGQSDEERIKKLWSDELDKEKDEILRKFWRKRERKLKEKKGEMVG